MIATQHFHYAEIVLRYAGIMLKLRQIYAKSMLPDD